jgi:uncharacterized protein (DUF433 family)
MARFLSTLLAFVLTSCGGGSSFAPPPINLSVSVNGGATVTVPPNATMVNVPVTIVAPTETASFSISGLPAGVTDSYKESESNPSGLLTLVAIPTTVPGTYMPTITVGSSGQTASVVFTLVISAPAKPGLGAMGLSFRTGGDYPYLMSKLHQGSVVDWINCPLVEINPRKLSGAPVLRGTRMQADSILENYADGMAPEEIAEVFELPVESVRALVAYAVQQNPAFRS